MTEDEFWQGMIDIGKRRRAGYKSCCAFIDLLGMTDLILNNIEEAQWRIDALHQGLVNSLDLYPSLNDSRASFFGDSIVILREIEPQEDLSEIYQEFCGYIFCINNIIAKIDSALGVGYENLRIVWEFNSA